MLHQENDKTVKDPNLFGSCRFRKKLPNHQLYLKILKIWLQC